jgi:X-X-X-Leu-X-X-Gly heptad repeat protein
MEEQKKRLRETDPQESLKVGLQTLASKSQKISAGVAAALAVLSSSDGDSDSD